MSPKRLMFAAIACMAVAQFGFVPFAVAADTSDKTHGDAKVASCLIDANENEVALAKIAQLNSADKNVQNFAKMMIEDHSAFAEKLRKFAPESSSTVSKTADPGDPKRGSFNFEAVQKEIAEKCLAAAKKELESKQGKEFDKCYIGMQIAAHQHMAVVLEVMHNHTSPELSSLLTEGLKTTNEHLEHAKKIMKSLE